MNRFYAHGKLLLSAEYMVIYGSKALALPLKQGQSLEITPTEDRSSFSWKAGYLDKTWFRARFDPGSLRILETSDQEKAVRLREMFAACIEMRPDFQEQLFRWDAVTNLEFSPDYGFGSSSTLTALVAEWAEVNPLELHFMVSEGSGYDVACALAEGPIIYKLRDQSPQYQHIPFSPPFSQQLWFAWLGRKEDTASHLEKISGSFSPGFEAINRFSQLTMAMAEASSLGEFRIVMEEHEDVLSRLLGMEKVSRRLEGLPGSVKSLGAWGGDFVMIASEAMEETILDYLHGKDIHVVFNYKDLVYEGAE
jgi:mevalonate kinase